MLRTSSSSSQRNSLDLILTTGTNTGNIQKFMAQGIDVSGRDCQGGKMEPGAFQVLVALRNVNQALLEGLKACVFILEKEEELTPERRKTLINSLKGMIEQGEMAFESVPSQDSAHQA